MVIEKKIKAVIVSQEILTLLATQSAECENGWSPLEWNKWTVFTSFKNKDIFPAFGQAPNLKCWRYPVV